MAAACGGHCRRQADHTGDAAKRWDGPQATTALPPKPPRCYREFCVLITGFVDR
jgi:hypothetical protein